MLSLDIVMCLTGHHLILQGGGDVTSFLLRYPRVSVWTVEDEEGPQDEPQQADGAWTHKRATT